MKDPNPSNKKVLVTGASRGIGQAITTYLAQNEFSVIAGARKEFDVEKLSKLKNVNGIKLDVSDDDQIQNAIDLVTEGGELYGLVNNAGQSDAGALIELESNVFSNYLNVNLMGPHKLIKGLFTLLKESKGRIINISSIAGLVYGNLRGSYFITKWALEAYTGQLRNELTKFDMKVSCVEPGIINTNIFDSIRRRFDEEQNRSNYFASELKQFESSYFKWKEKNLKSPELVAKAVHHALTASSPYNNYLIGNKEEQELVFDLMFDRIININKGLENNWTSEELMKLFSKKLNKTIK